MKKVILILALAALGVVVWAIPATSVRASSSSSVLTAQEDEPAEPAVQETESKEFTGKIANHEGKYTLQGEDGKTYQLDDQDKAKEFDGKNVKVTGTLDEESMTIQISEIEEVEA
jgi:hypothetical protein